MRLSDSRNWILAAGLLLIVFAGYGQSQENGNDDSASVDNGKSQQRASAELSAADVKAIAKEAYVYGFPIVMNYKTMHNYVVDEKHPEHKGPFNKLSCEARLFTPDDKAVVTPNADTPYCMFWMDVRAEPMVLTVPEIEPNRYYSFQLIERPLLPELQVTSSTGI